MSQESNNQGYRIDFDDPTTDPFSGVIIKQNSNPPVDEEPAVTESPQPEVIVDEDGIVLPEGSVIVDPVSDEDESAPEEPEAIDEATAEDGPGLYYFIGDELKKDGFIDPDISFDEKVDGMTVFNAYKEKLKKDAEPVIRQEAMQKLEEEGFDQNDLIVARAFRQGVDHRLLQQNTMYELYSKLPDDVPYDDQVTVISQMYRERGFNDVEIKSMIAVAEQNDNVDELFSNSRQYFGGKWNEFVREENTRVEERNKQALAEVRKADELLNRVVTSQELYGEKLTPAQAKEINDAVRSQNLVVEVNGVKQQASELQKFIIDFYNDPEFRLHAFKIFKYRSSDKEQLKNEAKKEVEDEFLGGYTQRLLKHTQLSKSKEVREQLNEKSKSSQAIFLDLSK